MSGITISRCVHCNGTGKCRCDACQKADGVSWRSASDAPCVSCGGGGKIKLSNISYDHPISESGHCSGTGSCRCDACQKAAGFAWRAASDAPCMVCRGAGKVVL